jgi:hypothetical protein
MNERLSRFVRALYFDIQKIDGVQPLEIWNGIREFTDPLEKTLLIKNLYKIVIPLVNEELFDQPFERHSRVVKEAVAALLIRLTGNPADLIFTRFPDPPVGDPEQKELYRAVKAEALPLVKHAVEASGQGAPALLFPDGLFDFREMRVVDNELPYIIFTDKEFKVIHGLVIAYLWLIGMDSLFLLTLKEHGVGQVFRDAYRRFARKVLKENPLVIRGKKIDQRDRVPDLKECFTSGDYLDVSESLYVWLESAQARFMPAE